MADREYKSIGETLALIREEFPEVTISKIRFLETQGLIAPERTTNGYRKFYDHDIERLAFVLRQQREQFLPLKVIKDRITEKEPGVFVLDPNKGRFTGTQKTKSSKFEKDIFGDPLTERAPNRQNPKANHKVEVRTGTTTGATRQGSTVQSRTNYTQPSAKQSGRTPVPAAGAPVLRNSLNSPGQIANEGYPTSSRNTEENRPASSKRPRLFALPSNSSLAESLDDVRSLHDGSLEESDSEDSTFEDSSETGFPKNSFTARDIAEQADLSLVQVHDLTTYGLLSPTMVRGQQIYSGADLELASLAKEFAMFGLEARHLKMYKVSAEREASFLEQVILPILANKSQKSRNRAEAALTQLGEIGAQFRTLLLERAIEKILKS